MICPKCGCTDDIRIEALVLIKFDGMTVEEIPQSEVLYEWNGDSDTVCGRCGHNAKAEDFGEPSVAHISDEEVSDEEPEIVILAVCGGILLAVFILKIRLLPIIMILLVLYLIGIMTH